MLRAIQVAAFIVGVLLIIWGTDGDHSYEALFQSPAAIIGMLLGIIAIIGHFIVGYIEDNGRV